MELEEWIQADMKRFVKQREPREHDVNAVRHEDAGFPDNKDYQKEIQQALLQGRFPEATAIFKELKQRFMNTPIDHQEERKRYYRILQKTYRAIYEYVADQHKTHRIISQLAINADPFDQRVIPVDLNLTQPQGKTKVETVEVAMLREKRIPNMPAFKKQKEELPEPEQSASETPKPSGKQSNKNPITSSDKTAGAESAKKNTPPPPPPVNRKIRFIQAAQDDGKSPEDFLKGEPQPVNDAPGWNPLGAIVVKQRAPERIDSVSVRLDTVDVLLTQASALLDDGDAKSAQRKLIEARFELSRTPGDQKLTNRLQTLEGALANFLTPTNPIPEDHEVFSKFYMQGIQAMASGDYLAASKLFQQRVQQAPNDRAARIRLQECMEVLRGSAA